MLRSTGMMNSISAFIRGYAVILGTIRGVTLAIGLFWIGTTIDAFSWAMGQYRLFY